MTGEAITLRQARADDIPRIVELITSAELPPLFIAENLDGFVVVERAEGVVACGGLELFGRCGVIRSVVVDPELRGSGVGRTVWERLEQDARGAALTDLYLFTGDAHDFWSRLGFVDVTFDEWKAEARMNWQYQFLSQNQDLFPREQLHIMWRAA